MSRILILHEIDDETTTVARQVAKRCLEAGQKVVLQRADAPSGPLHEAYDAVVVGCDLGRGGLSTAMRAIIERHHGTWERVPSAYFTILSASTTGPSDRQRLDALRIIRATGWRPVLSATFSPPAADAPEIERFTDGVLHAINTIQRRRPDRARASRLLATGAVLGTALAAYAYKQHTQGLRGFGATAKEQAAAFSGDELVRGATQRTTFAVDIQAPPADVWPWLIQLGYRRGGWYGYDLVDNGAQRSAQRILAEHQTLHEGEPVPVDGREDAGLRVAKMQQDRNLILTWTPVGRPGATVAPAALWSFHLIPQGTHGTRLIVRILGNGTHPWSEAAGTLVSKQIAPLMQRRQLAGIKMRAERLYRIHRSRARRYGEQITPP